MITEAHDIDLPDNPTTDAFVQLIGADAMAQLSIDLGGRSIAIPLTPGEHSPIAASVGLAAARKISQVYGGMNFEIPVTIGIEELIMRHFNEGMAINRIAQTLRITRGRIYSVLKRGSKKDQYDLFK